MPLRSFTEAEIALMARRRLERPLLATIWLGIVMFSLVEGNLFYALAGSFAVGVNLLAVEWRRELYVHRLWVNIAVLAALAVLLLEVHARRTFLPWALAHFMILIQVCKLFERKANRDYVQMLALSILTVVTAALYSQAIWLALMLLVYLVLVAYSGMILTIKRGLDATAQARLVCETTPLSASRVAWNSIHDWPGRAVMGRLTTVLAVMVVVGGVVFFLAPREELLGPSLLPESSVVGRSGFSQALRLGRPRKIELSDKIVMRVIYNEGSSVLTGSLRYFRGRAMENYSRSGWNDAARSPTAAPQVSTTLLRSAVPLEIMMASTLLPDLFAPYPVLHWETRGVRLRIGDDMTAGLYRGARSDRPFRYKVYVLPEPLTDWQQRRLAAAFQPDLGDPPSRTVEVTPRVERLARQWCGDLLANRPTDADRRGAWNVAVAERIAQRLQRECTYSLDLSSANPSRDAVEDFLFHMKRGHCEYFASALTVMCRALDVPARLVTGFLVDEVDGAVGKYVVRERDAHAWTEVYHDQDGWVIVDATPPMAGTYPSRSWRQRMGDFFDRLAYHWYNNVVGYDAAVQKRVWAVVIAFLRQGWDGLRRTALAIRRSLTNLLVHGYIDQAMVRLSVALGLMAAVLEAALLIRIARRTHRRRRAAVELATRPWGALAFIPLLLDRLERHCLGGQANRTAMEAAQQVEQCLPLPPGQLGELVALYYRARWGDRHLGAEEVTAAKHRTEALEALVAAVPHR